LYRKRAIEDYLGIRGLKKLGKKKWRMIVEHLTARFVSALHLDDVVTCGGNARNLEELPPGCRLATTPSHFWENIVFESL